LQHSFGRELTSHAFRLSFRHTVHTLHAPVHLRNISKRKGTEEFIRAGKKDGLMLSDAWRVKCGEQDRIKSAALSAQLVSLRPCAIFQRRHNVANLIQ
jgi:hypothetical protein